MSDVDIKGSPAVILIAGLQGSGKTTFSGKLANHLKSKKGRQPLLVACDVYRPAAIEQLKVLGSQIGIPVFTEEGNNNPVAIAKAAIAYAKSNSYNVVIVDTAGRLAVDEAMKLRKHLSISLYYINLLTILLITSRSFLLLTRIMVPTLQRQ